MVISALLVFVPKYLILGFDHVELGLIRLTKFVMTLLKMFIGFLLVVCMSFLLRGLCMVEYV